MSTATTGIAWTNRTWNPMRGCSRVSSGCEHCYAEGQANRFKGAGQPYEGLVALGKRGPRWSGAVRFVPHALAEPLGWRAPARVFVDSMSDLFHDGFTNEQIAAVFGVMAAAPRHTFQVLTKRPERMRAWFEWHRQQSEADGEPWIPIMREAISFLPERIGNQLQEDGIARDGVPELEPWPLPNVHLGVSVENQEYADKRIPHLLATPAAVRFLSVEPLLGPVDLNVAAWGKGLPRPSIDIQARQIAIVNGMRLPLRALDWVIVGGESGPCARPCDVAWIRAIAAQCRAAGVPCFVKQLGAHVRWDGFQPAGGWWPDGTRTEGGIGAGWRVHLRDRKGADPAEWPEDLRVQEMPEVRP